MIALARLFPRHGSQTVGMCAELLETDPDLTARYLDAADAASAQPVRQTCPDGPIELLTWTDVAQPALFSVSLVLADIAALLFDVSFAPGPTR